jgi:hypothetical protein
MPEYADYLFATCPAVGGHTAFICPPPSSPLDYAEIVAGCFGASPPVIRHTAALVVLLVIRKSQNNMVFDVV